MNIFVHPTAEVSAQAKIGDGTKIWNNAQVRENAVIGRECVLSKNVYVDAGVQIGNHVKIQNNVNVYSGVTIEDGVFLGPSMTFTNDMYPRSLNTDWQIKPTRVCCGASIGAGAVIVCDIVIGRYAMIGSGSVVTKNVPEHALMVGNPARRIGWVCRCGFPLDVEGRCTHCGESYPQYADAADKR